MGFLDWIIRSPESLQLLKTIRKEEWLRVQELGIEVLDFIFRAVEEWLDYSEPGYNSLSQ
jgi:hypothetical protein